MTQKKKAFIKKSEELQYKQYLILKEKFKDRDESIIN